MGIGESRRDFLRRSGQALLSYGAFSAMPADLQDTVELTNEAIVRAEGFSILQGLTTDTFTKLTVDVPKDMRLQYELIDLSNGQILPVTHLNRITRDHSSWGVDRLMFQELHLGHPYELRVYDTKNELLDSRRLSTLDLQKREARIAVLSCMLDYFPNKSEKWESFFRAKPDLCFFIGDNVYGDIGMTSAGPAMLWRRYIETRRRVPFYRAKILTPCLAVWDDHDFGKNDSDHTYPHKEDSLATFQAFFGQDESVGPYSRGPGVSSQLTAFGHQFIFLDNRYYRGTLINGDRSYWGEDQSKWWQQQMRQSANPVWLMQGCQFFGGYSRKNQSFEKNFQNDFMRFKNVMRSANRPSLLLAGDIHFTEVMQIESEQLGYPTYELTSSSMHSFPRVGIDPNPRRQVVESGHNHLFVDIKAVQSGASYDVTSVAKSAAVRFRRHITI
jgi:alkaline phosphatase D